MREALIRYCTLFGSLALVSVAAVPILAVRSSSLGVPAPVGLGATSPVLALGAVLLAFALFAAVAAFVARILNIAVALFVAGWGFSVVALACGNVQSFLWSGGAPATQAIETLVSSVPVAVVRIRVPVRAGPALDTAAPAAVYCFWPDGRIALPVSVPETVSVTLSALDALDVAHTAPPA